MAIRAPDGANKILSASPALVIVTNWSVVHQIACDQGGIADTCYGYLECQNKILKGISSFEKASDDMR